MQDSKLKTIAVPDVATFTPGGGDGSTVGTPIPNVVFQTTNKAMRLMLRNVSLGVTIALSHQAEGVQTQPVGSDTYELPPGACDVFVLAPNQKLYGIALGTGGRLSFAASEALPLDVRRES
jgi:hypothetical protein